MSIFHVDIRVFLRIEIWCHWRKDGTGTVRRGVCRSGRALPRSKLMDALRAHRPRIQQCVRRSGTMNITRGPYSANVDPIYLEAKHRAEYQVVISRTEHPFTNRWRMSSKRPCELPRHTSTGSWIRIPVDSLRPRRTINGPRHQFAAGDRESPCGFGFRCGFRPSRSFARAHICDEVTLQ
jgi:hypothetical protein